jgi:dihydropyrimidinase
VHVSTVLGAQRIAQARQDLPVTCETGPQYLFLDDDNLKAENGHRFICSPPLRPKDGMNELRRMAAQGGFDALATDHCAFSKKDKDRDKSDYAKVPNGLPGIGALAPLAFEVARDPLFLSTHLSLNPAKITGLYPRKGAIQKGADADLVILDTNGPARAIKSSLADVHDAYEGRTTTLDFKYVLLRGDIIVRDNALASKTRMTGKRV